MNFLEKSLVLTLAVTAWSAFAQSSEVAIQTPPAPRVVGRFLKPFHLERRQVAPARLANSPRLEALVRGGNLYLSVQDVIALALENNLDIAVQRFVHPIAEADILRARSGQAARGVPGALLPSGLSAVSYTHLTLPTIYSV